jgi:hypothetical protein
MKSEKEFLEQYYARLASSRKLDAYVAQERAEKIKERSSIPLCINCGKAIKVGDPIQLIEVPPSPTAIIKSFDLFGPYCREEKTEFWKPNQFEPAPNFNVLKCSLLPPPSAEEKALLARTNEARFEMHWRSELEMHDQCDFCTYRLSNDKPRWLITAGRSGDYRGFEIVGAYCSDAHAQKCYTELTEKNIYEGPDTIYGLRRPVRFDPPEHKVPPPSVGVEAGNGAGEVVGNGKWDAEAIMRMACQRKSFRITGHDILESLVEIAERDPENVVLGIAVSLVFGTGKFLTAEEKRDLTYLIGDRPRSKELTWRMGKDSPTRRPHAK